jgi:hypothetical protein
MFQHPEFNYICLQNINRIAPQFGIIWNNIGDSNPCIDYLNYSYNDFYYMKYISEWFKKSLCLSIFGLHELIDDVEIKDMYQKVYKYSSKELKKMKLAPYYDDIRLNINSFLTKEKKNINNESFDDIYKNFIKTIIRTLMSNGNFNTNDIEKYINVIYIRFVNCLNFKEIKDKLNLDTAEIGLANIVFKYISEFKKAYSSDEHMKVLCTKFENFYDTAFEMLDDSDYVERNNKLKGIKMFQKYFITDQLGEYVNN